MGYLLAIYYKNVARKTYLQCQADLTEITRKAKFAKKQAEECLKGIEYQAKMLKNNGLAQANARIAALREELYLRAGIDPEAVDPSNIDEDTQDKIRQIEQQVTTQTQMIMQEVTAYNNQVDLWEENVKHMQYDPLKQEDELLAEQKESKEEDCQIAKQEYESAQKLAGEELKNVVPQWGVQG